MGILEALATGFVEATSLEVLPYLAGGAVFGLVMGVIPGLSGHFALAMVVPFLYSLSPPAGIAFLLGSHSTVAQGGGLTAILFSTPGCGQNAATLLDGPAMRDRGLAGQAAGAAMSACFLGAVFGAVVLALLLPVLQSVVLFFGPAEISMLVLLALTFVAILGREDVLRSLIAGLAGLLLATVGLDNMTNTERYTFGLLDLRDGLPLVPVILGLFAAAEMMAMWARGGSLAGPQSRSLGAREVQRQVFAGVAAAFRHWWLVLRCGSIGAAMGLIPGLGSTAASFMAYGHARQSSKHPETFGEGNIEGVISAEAANDAVEGGALASTLAFGIPGSSSMAIVLAGLFVLGLHTGPEIVSEKTDLVFVMIFTIIFGNLCGTVLGLFLVNPLSRLTFLPVSQLVPVLLSVIFTGAYAVHGSMFDVGIVLLAGWLGYLMKVGGYSRAALLIGFVLGSVLEKNLFLAIQLDGPAFFLRPVPLGLLAVTLALLAFSLRPGARAGSRRREAAEFRAHETPALLVAGGVFALALVTAISYGPVPAAMPLVILAPLVPLTALQGWRAWSAQRSARAPGGEPRSGSGAGAGLGRAVGLAGWSLALVGLVLVAGHYAGMAIFMYLLIGRSSGRGAGFALAVSVAVTLAVFAVFELGFGIGLYQGLVYKALAGYRLF